MFGKTFILGLVLAAGAGGVVYYGSSALEVGDMPDLAGAHPTVMPMQKTMPELKVVSRRACRLFAPPRVMAVKNCQRRTA